MALGIADSLLLGLGTGDALGFVEGLKGLVECLMLGISDGLMLDLRGRLALGIADGSLLGLT